MTGAAHKILDEFQRLPETDKRLVLVELLRETLTTPYEPVSDETLVAAADQLFLELDRRETA